MEKIVEDTKFRQEIDRIFDAYDDDMEGEILISFI